MKTQAKRKERAVFFLEPDVRRALRIDAATRAKDMSEVVNDLLREKLRVKAEKQTA